MKSQRMVYRETLTQLAEQNKKIICMEADLGGDNHLFQKKFPERFFNIGIAEHTLIGIAAGLAKTGFIPFISTFAPFAVLRAAEMVKLSMAYMHFNIKLVCPYAGVSGAWFGPTHHCLEDIGILQTMPGLIISAPHGAQETADTVRWATVIEKPVYIRLGRNGIFNDIDYIDAFSYPNPRRGFGWSDESKIVLISVGETGTELVATLREELEFRKLSHLHLPFLSKEALSSVVKIIKSFKKVLVVEEAREFGSIASSLALLSPKQEVYSFSPNDIWPCFGGTHEEILAAMDFSLEKLKEKILNLL